MSAVFPMSDEEVGEGGRASAANVSSVLASLGEPPGRPNLTTTILDDSEEEEDELDAGWGSEEEED